MKDENNGVKLTGAVYKLLDFFPDGEPLKNRAKDKVLEITENLIKEKESSELSENIEILLNYFKIAKSLGWINDVNFLIISKEYEDIRNRMSSVKKDNKQEAVISSEADIHKKKESVKVSDFPISGRQKKILQVLEEKGKAQVSDFKVVLADITKRTIRRDLDELLKHKKIIRVGEWNQVFYEIFPKLADEENKGVDRTIIMS